MCCHETKKLYFIVVGFPIKIRPNKKMARGKKREDGVGKTYSSLKHSAIGMEVANAIVNYILQKFSKNPNKRTGAHLDIHINTFEILAQL